jgi:hypothetical protein
VSVPTAPRGDEISGIATVGIGHHDGIAVAFAGTDIDDSRSIRGPARRERWAAAENYIRDNRVFEFTADSCLPLSPWRDRGCPGLRDAAH